MSRQHILDDPERLELFAELYSSGLPRREIATVFAVHPDTVTKWLGRAEVQAAVNSQMKARANRILRKVDAAIEGMVNNEDMMKKMDLKDLLAIRRDFTPKQVQVGGPGDFDAAAEYAAWAALDMADEPGLIGRGHDADADAEEFDGEAE
jgi:hypothetical protein